MLREICHWLSFLLFSERACVRIVYFLLMLMFACTKRKSELLHFQLYMPSRWHSFILLTFILLRVDQRVRKGSVTYVQEARYLKARHAQADSDLWAEISRSTVKVQRSGYTCRGTVIRSSLFSLAHPH